MKLLDLVVWILILILIFFISYLELIRQFN
jgi:hypothetical protein